MAVKAVMLRHFSIIVFGLTQIAIDLEVLWYLIHWDLPLHRFWHTYLGATIVFVTLTIVGKPVSQIIKLVWNYIASRCSNADVSVPVNTSWFASFTGASVGAYSHILLDSMFHSDMEPLQPWSSENVLFGMTNPSTLSRLCVFFGILGLTWYLVWATINKVRK